MEREKKKTYSIHLMHNIIILLYICGRVYTYQEWFSIWFYMLYRLPKRARQIKWEISAKLRGPFRIWLVWILCRRTALKPSRTTYSQRHKLWFEIIAYVQWGVRKLFIFRLSFGHETLESLRKYDGWILRINKILISSWWWKSGQWPP